MPWPCQMKSAENVISAVAIRKRTSGSPGAWREATNGITAAGTPTRTAER